MLVLVFIFVYLHPKYYLCLKNNQFINLKF